MSLARAKLLTQDQAVHLAGPQGSCFGRVLLAEAWNTLPAITGAPDARMVGQILTEMNVLQVAMIGWKHNGRAVCTLVFGDGEGAWADSKGQPVTIRDPQGPDKERAEAATAAYRKL